MASSGPKDNSVQIHADNPVVRVLLIDDEADTLLPNLAQGLEPIGFEFHKESSATRALRTVASIRPDVILLDLHFPGDDSHGGRTTGGKLLSNIRRRFDAVAVVVFTTRLDDLNIPLETFDEPPHGYFSKPRFDLGTGWVPVLARAIRDAIDTVRFARDPDTGDLGFLVGKTKEMRDAAAKIHTAAGNNLPVLIYGETGTGKQRAAEAIHRLSNRGPQRFEHLNCSGVHVETLESALFGHVRGAFSGALNDKPGLFELADGGTLFLDEIQRMPMELQAKLVIAVESGKVRRMQATVDRQVDVRLIVATNRNLADLVAEGVLREDLAHRFTHLLIDLPPLRKRAVDLPELFKGFVAEANTELGKSVLDTLRPETLAKLQDYDWPGNIRELETTIERAVAHTRSNILLPQDIVLTELRERRSAQVSVDAEGHAIRSVPGKAKTIASGMTVGDRDEKVVKALTDKLESLSIEERYPFLRGQQDPDLRKAILIEFVRRLRERTGQKVSHESLAEQLDKLPDEEKETEARKKVLARIRQLVNKDVKLREL